MKYKEESPYKPDAVKEAVLKPEINVACYFWLFLTLSVCARRITNRTRPKHNTTVVIGFSQIKESTIGTKIIA
jgi:hypothetical protein